MTKEALITYIKHNDKYFAEKYLDDYSLDALIIIKKNIEAELMKLPKGYRLYSNGYKMIDLKELI